MTEVLSNNAVAVLLTPIAIALAKSLGHDPRAYVVAVMFSATVAFATPIGYQTHMMVYGPAATSSATSSVSASRWTSSPASSPA